MVNSDGLDYEQEGIENQGLEVSSNEERTEVKH